MDEEAEGEACRIATNAALDAALDHCSTEDLESNVARMVGLDDPPECRKVTDELDQADCMDMATVRKWVVCRAVELVESDEEPVTDAIERAWDEANGACGW